MEEIFFSLPFFTHFGGLYTYLKSLPVKKEETELRHLMSPLDFSVEELYKLMELAGDIEKNPEQYAHACDGKILATCFPTFRSLKKM